MQSLAKYVITSYVSAASRTNYSTLTISANAPCHPRRLTGNEITARCLTLFHVFANHVRTTPFRAIADFLQDEGALGIIKSEGPGEDDLDDLFRDILSCPADDGVQEKPTQVCAADVEMAGMRKSQSTTFSSRFAGFLNFLLIVLRARRRVLGNVESPAKLG